MTQNKAENAAPRSLKIALIQFPRRLITTDEALGRLLEMLPEAKGADLACLPEAWSGVGAFEPDRLSRWLARMAKAAGETGVNLLTGALFMKMDDGAIRSAGHLVRRDGSIEGPAAKLFPSQAIGERKFCAPGDGLRIFEVGGVRVGLAVCVDAIYPEPARRLALAGAEVIVNPANIPSNRNDLWRAITQTRAAENTVFAVYANNAGGGGYRDGRDVNGHSLIASPAGEILLEMGGEPGVGHAELDLGKIAEVRKRWPYLADIRERGWDGGGPPVS